MAIQTDSLAQVYAKSLFQLAEEAGGQDKIVEVGDELEQICEMISSDKAFREFLRSPIIEKNARSNTVRGIFNDRVTDLTLRFLLVLNEKGRLGHLVTIAAAYDQMLQDAFGRVEVDLYTPGPVEAEQLERIKKKIQQALGKEPIVYTYTDPDMIGGIKLRVGDQLIDASVATRLRRMKDRLLTQGSASVRDRIDTLLDDTGGAGT